MTADRWARIDAILQAALVRPPEARESFVEDACGNDASLRDEVTSLLAHAQSADGFLEAKAENQPARLEPGRQLGPYAIGEFIAAGGMGDVYRARDPRLGRDVALKLLPPAASGDPDRLRRFEQEARAAAALNHPNIVTIHSVEQADGLRFITMELVEGEPLSNRIPRGGLPLDRLLDVAVPLADAIGAAHARGVVHRDLKPANVMVTPEGRVKILDFGLAKLRPLSSALESPTESTHTVTGEGRLLGTVAYMSPEQAEGREVDHRSDIFSLGVMLHELATGQRPFKGDSSLSLLSSILRDAPASVSDLKPALPQEFARVVQRCLAKDPNRRYQSAIDLRNDLEELRQPQPAGGVGQTPSAQAGQRRRRRSMVLLGGAVALAALTAAWFAWPRPAAPTPRSSGPKRLTFAEGLQMQPVWSPNGEFVAYSSNESGNLDIWVQSVDGGAPYRLTTDPSNDWQPDWSPDGNWLAFRSERGDGGVFVIPAPLGGAEKRVAPIGFSPKWVDASRILVVLRPAQTGASFIIPHIYLVDANPNGQPPRRILEKELAQFTNVGGGIALHPDRKRISFQGTKARLGGLWTQSLEGGAALRAEPNPEFQKQYDQVVPRRNFKWAVDGDALYFEGTAQGVTNVWRVDVDPITLRWLGGFSQLTNGPGIDSHLSVAPVGEKLAFVIRSEASRLWSLPFDADARRLKGGDATPLTPPNISVEGFDLWSGGPTLVYIARRQGKGGIELWSGPLGGQHSPVLDAYDFLAPRVSHDGTRVAYRITPEPGPNRLGWRTIGIDKEHRPVDGPRGDNTPWDWSPLGTHILHSCPNPGRFSLCESLATATTSLELRQVLSDPAHNLYQGRYSPDGSWIVFNAQTPNRGGASVLGVVPAAGGKWTAITDANFWADKPRWAPDGKTIYYISDRARGFCDVWGIAFDAVKGVAVGPEFAVTRHDNPGRTVSCSAGADLAVTPTRLVVPIIETTGSIWILDGIRKSVRSSSR